MKKINKAFLFALLVLFGCKTEIKQKNQFSSLSDTLILKTEKIKGYGLFSGSGYSLEFQDTAGFYDFPVVFPENITNIKIANEYVDFKPFWYGNIKKNKSKYITTFLKDYFPKKIDTLSIPSMRDNSISIMTGQREKDTIFIVDENNNKDFRDDSIRLYRKIDFRSTSNFIKCKYNIYNGEKLVEDFGWVKVVADRNEEFSFSVSHHLESNFLFNKQRYQIEVVNGMPFHRFCFENPLLAMVSQNGVKKDSLLKSEMLDIGEYLKLDDIYFRFVDVSNDGRFITMVKEKDVSNKIGTQVGFIAPDFNCHTIENDTLRSQDYRGKYLLLVNVSPCWSEKSSYECFKELSEAYNSKIIILGIDNAPTFLKQNIKVLNLTGQFVIADDNPSIKKNYREDYCSRTCFLINPEGRIEDKFEIFDWKAAMAKHFN